MKSIRRHFIALIATVLVAGSAVAASPAPTRVLFKTSAGNFVVELNAEKAPKSVENFLQYVRDKFYNGTTFHRVIGNFMIQGGGFTTDMHQKPTRAPIPLEASNGLKNERGTIAMARTNDPNSATSQFFINVVDNQMLNAPSPDGFGYAVFGKVVSGMETVEKIRATPTGMKNNYGDVPLTPIEIISAEIQK